MIARAEVIAAWLSRFDAPTVGAVRARVTPAVTWQDAPPQLPEPIDAEPVKAIDGTVKVPARKR